ncbi:hypothetical protein AB205_0149730 [Aquarana catesbeiana]|uniref:Uncharacterized protein n=1 Tax=Aquarana catesbeiana TaxID=8400 RepID=A0A2G9RI45_AQUCT|nr:hypothetical protein AB205_0149730 [Aquarana catesbeiana]
MKGVTWTWQGFEEFTTSRGRRPARFFLRIRDITRLWGSTRNSQTTPSMSTNS